MPRHYTRKEKICQRCDDTFMGGATSKYCYECKEIVEQERQKIANKKAYLKRKNEKTTA